MSSRSSRSTRPSDQLPGIWFVEPEGHNTERDRRTLMTRERPEAQHGDERHQRSSRSRCETTSKVGLICELSDVFTSLKQCNQDSYVYFYRCVNMCSVLYMNIVYSYIIVHCTLYIVQLYIYAFAPKY